MRVEEQKEDTVEGKKERKRQIERGGVWEAWLALLSCAKLTGAIERTVVLMRCSSLYSSWLTRRLKHSILKFAAFMTQKGGHRKGTGKGGGGGGGVQ